MTTASPSAQPQETRTQDTPPTSSSSHSRHSPTSSGIFGAAQGIASTALPVAQLALEGEDRNKGELVGMSIGQQPDPIASLVEMVKSGTVAKDAITDMNVGVAQTSGLDDRKMLLEPALALLCSLPPDTKIGDVLADSTFKLRWNDLQHAPISSLGDGKDDSVHGGGNYYFAPRLGAAGEPYARSVVPQHATPKRRDPAAVMISSSSSVPNLQNLASSTEHSHTTEEPPLASTSTATSQRSTTEASKKPKRPRISHPTPRHSVSTPTLAATIARALAGPAFPPDSPYHDYVWSFFPPLLPDASPPWPLHPHLIPSNYTHHPQHVVSCAGLVPSTSYQSYKCRTGWIWVEKESEEEAIKWAESIRAKSGEGDPEKKTVWFLKVEAIRKVGLCDLGKGNEILTFL